MSVAQPALSVSVDRIATAFNSWAEADPIDGMDTYWWWARDVRVDPDEVIASDGRGGTFRVPFTTDGDHDVEFGDPVEVRQTYVDVSAPTAALSAAAARTQQRALATDLPRPEKLDRTDNPAASRPDNNEEHPMDDNVRQALARQHGLDPDTATEDEVTAAVIAAEANPETPETPETPEGSETPETPETPEPVSETVTLTAAQYASLQRGAEAGVAAQAALEQRTQAEQEAQRAAERDTYLNTKVADGTLHRNDLPIYQLAYDQDAARARQTIDALSPGLVPALERTAPDTPGPSAQLPEDGSVPEGLSLLTPAQRAQRA